MRSRVSNRIALVMRMRTAADSAMVERLVVAACSVAAMESAVFETLAVNELVCAATVVDADSAADAMEAAFVPVAALVEAVTDVSAFCLH